MRVNDLLLPIVKGYASSARGAARHRVAADARWLPGSSPSTPVAIVRDAKIDTLYEGATAIQGQDFFFRKIVKDQARRWATSRPRSSTAS